MSRKSLLSRVLSLVLVSLAPLASAATRVASEKHMIAALDPGIQLQVLNRHPQGQSRFAPERIVLFVHGATFPTASAFDVDLPGGSWLSNLAERGFDVYAVDVRGYGGSTRPAALAQDPKDNAPVAVTRDAVRDVSAAVEFILKRRGVGRVNLIGWSWGTTTMATFAAENPGKVVKLVLYAPVWVGAPGPPYQGAYRTGTHDSVRTSNTNGIPKDRVEEISPSAWFDKWWSATLATDPGGASRSPPVLRAPNGVFKDLTEFWAAGKPFYDPAAILAPTLLIVGEWDKTTPPAGALELFTRLTGTKDKRVVIVGEGTHQLSLEKNRMHLIREVQQFLEES